METAEEQIQAAGRMVNLAQSVGEAKSVRVAVMGAGGCCLRLRLRQQHALARMRALCHHGVALGGDAD